MKGYNKPYKVDLRTVEENVWVGCRRCLTTWHEKMKFFASSTRINSCSYTYDYCDACITQDEMNAQDKGCDK